jgi:hypothetical protein
VVDINENINKISIVHDLRPEKKVAASEGQILSEGALARLFAWL